MTQLIADSTSDPRSDLSQILHASLGHEVDSEIFERLADMQLRLQNEQRKLGLALITNQISREDYIAELQEILREARTVGVKLLGLKDFTKVFGDFTVEQMVDPSAF